MKDSAWFQVPDRSSGNNLGSVEILEEKVEKDFNEKSKLYLFMEGIASLKQSLQQIGSIADPSRRRLLARIYHHISWFYLHSGYDTSAYRYAAWSMELSLQTYEMNLKTIKSSATSSIREAGEFLNKNIDLFRYSETARIMSLAMRKLGHPQKAWEVLDKAYEATTMSGETVGSEYFRQRGALLLKENVERARNFFNQAAAAMRHKNEYRSEAHLRMVATRNLNIIDQNCDEALELTNDVRKTFGTGSLEHVLNAHYAAACCFSTDSKDSIGDGLSILRSVQRYAKHFGNQATISKLLEITPSFNLSDSDRRIWIMHVLETNAFAGK